MQIMFKIINYASKENNMFRLESNGYALSVNVFAKDLLSPVRFVGRKSVVTSGQMCPWRGLHLCEVVGGR